MRADRLGLYSLVLGYLSVVTKVACLPVRLRFLATNHIFKETLPDVFANNCLSSLMDTDKPVELSLVPPEVCLTFYSIHVICT